MSLAVTLAGIAWDPTIRGILVVATGAAVLFGSVWLMVSTNIGTRLGTLMVFSSFFGWMFIMAVIWWIYGIGWVGTSPAWHTLDINVGGTAATVDSGDCGTAVSAVDVARRLVDPSTLPSAYDLVVSSDNETAKAEFASEIDPTRLEGLDAAAQARAKADWDLRNRTTTLSELAAVAPELTNSLDYGKGWRLLNTAQSGEAVASASTHAVEEGYFADATAFKVLDTFDLGGKVRLNTNPNRGDRIVRKLRTMTQVFSPPHYVAVQLQAVVPQTAAPGQAPPRPVVDEASPIVTVIMERDLGNKRLYPFLTALGSLLLFAVSATMLHYRDKEAMARRAAASAR